MATLGDRYELVDGRIFLTGVQALVRLLLDQHRADHAAGLRTATFVSGYQGSPLAGFDKELAGLGGLMQANDIVHRPAVNEELGATAVWGSQLSQSLPGPRYDGVVGVWYGKAPGVDRAADAIRHGNYVGTHPRGGVLALCGDDPACKSSTIPSASEALLAALKLPIFVPGSVQEILDMGRHAIACSRASGVWSAFKVVTNVADAGGTAEVGAHRVNPVMPTLEYEGAPYVHTPSAQLLAPASLEMERTLVQVRLALAKRYAQLNGLNRIVRDGAGARIGIVAAGATAHDVNSALAELGLTEQNGPVRVLQVGMLFPLDEEIVRRFAESLEEVLVVEEKGPFLERLVRDALYGGPATPPVLGEFDEHGEPLVAQHGTLNGDSIARIIARRLLAREDLPAVRERLERLDQVAARATVDLGVARTPFFCAGCPHNTSTVADADAIVGAGIGCHTMVMVAPNRHGKVTGVTQMGGEGAQWIGLAPFVDVPHFIQNLGDGTFHHSGSLAIRAAIGANVNVTYKLLFNGHVAMTGGQHVEGQLAVPDAARSLAAEGVKQIVITTDHPERYAGVELPPIASVRDRRDVLRVQRELAQVPGVTVLLHDQECAAELRRARKRGQAPEPRERVIINERVCEGCGDCGAKSGCLAVEPVETEFGRKTRVNQTACNKDLSCLEGDCPSFITVIAPATDRAAVRRPDVELPPAPVRAERDDVRVRVVGVGGGGVLTVSQVLQMASLLEGLHTMGVGQTGLSQKAGPVVSDLRFTAAPDQKGEGVTVPDGSVDVLLGCDVVGTVTPAMLRGADPGRTVAVVNDGLVPTGRMIVEVDAQPPSVAAARAAIDGVTREGENVYIDAQRIAEELLGDVTPANVVVLGAALQRGLIPVSLAAVEQAFRLNAVGVERNLAALAWGRAWVAAPEVVLAALNGRTASPAVSARSRALVTIDDPALSEVVARRADDLIGWGGLRVARRYAETVARIYELERARVPGSTAFAATVARGLHKLTAYKDEYEVARLHLEWLATVPAGSKVKFQLHPPVLRALGRKRKIGFGRWFVPMLALLRRARVLRGTPLDLFGLARVRRVERALPGEYMQLVSFAGERLSPETIELAVEAAALPELIRGYEQIKLDGVERFRASARELRDELARRPELVDSRDRLAGV
jgi:indolepyruvate ferredoxin oxidoreductase